MSSSIGKEISKGFPGLEYLERVGSVWLKVMVGETSALNTAWKEIRDGNYEFKTAMKTWASAVEGMSSILVEASRGPAFIRQPAWVFFEYDNKAKSPDALKGAVKIARAEDTSTNLIASPFLPFGGGTALQAVCSATWANDHSTILVTVSTSSFKTDGTKAGADAAATGRFLSFITVKGRTAEEPLAIVGLNVTP